MEFLRLSVDTDGRGVVTPRDLDARLLHQPMFCDPKHPAVVPAGD